MSLRYKQAAADQPPVATEVIDGDHFQLLKLVVGTPGSKAPVVPLQEGGTVSLSTATLAALESITAVIASFPSDYPDAAVLARLEAIRVLLASTLTVIGPLTDAQLRASAVAITDSERGSWGYSAGVSGTVNVAANRRVIGIAAHSIVGGSLTINGGDSVIIPANGQIAIQPKGNLVAPTLVFTATSSYFIESVI